MLGKNEVEIVRILEDLVSSVDSFSVSVPFLMVDLLRARQLACYRNLIQKVIREINSGIPLEDIRVKKSCP